MPWYDDKKRLLLEKSAIEKFNGFRFIKKGSQLGAVGKITTKKGDVYDIKILFPDNYPNKVPNVYCMSPSLRDSPHQLSNNKLCYCYEYEWHSNYTVAVAIGWAAKWFDAYDHWKKTGKWKGKEAAY